MNKTYKEVLRNRANGNGIRRGTLNLVTPNPDPKAPNDPSRNHGGKSNTNGGNGSRGNSGRKHNQNSQSGAQSSSSTTSSNQSGGSASSQQLFAPPTDPRDSTYWRDVITLQQNRNSSLSQNNLEQTYSNSAYQTALQNLQFQEPKDIRSIKENANRAGGFYSSVTGENIGQTQINYFNQRSELARNKQQDDALRQIARDAIEQGYTVDEAAALAEATDRQSQAEMSRAAPTSNNDVLQQLLAALGKQPNVNNGKNNKKNKKGKRK